MLSIKSQSTLKKKFFHSENFRVATKNTENRLFLIQIEEIIHQCLSIETEFNVTTFSKKIGMSRMQLHRKLKEIVGMSTSKLIRLERLKFAKEKLLNSNLTISEIAYITGFNSPSFFTKCFKERYHCTPSDFRKLNHEEYITLINETSEFL